MKNYFNITMPYRFEMNDLRALTMLINVALVMIIGFSASWFGLAIAVFGLIKDALNRGRHVNDFVMHGASTLLNCYFLYLKYFVM